MRNQKKSIPLNIWITYKLEKDKISNIGLSCKEYDKAINEICERLGI